MLSLEGKHEEEEEEKKRVDVLVVFHAVVVL